MNAIGTIDQLPSVNRDIPKILGIATFTAGNAYADFNPDMDKVAAWTIGGLVAGKILAKAGLFTVILKFLAPLWKFLVALVLPIGVWVKKRFNRKQTEEYAPVPAQPEDPSNSGDTTA